MKVLKFGGTSVGKPERIRNIGDILSVRVKNGESLTVVCSAFGGVTDMLLDMSTLAEQGDEQYLVVLDEFIMRHKQAAKDLLGRINSQVERDLEENYETLAQLLKGVFLLREATPRTKDYLLSFGERNSCYIIAQYLKSIGLNAEYGDARKFIKTDKSFGTANVDFETTNEYVRKYFNDRVGKIVIVTGFISTDQDSLTTTLGRGGSDYTAAILASALNAEALEIWTDVDGVLTCDPRKVPNAYTLDALSYNEAMELSHFGAKVIYPPTIQPALANKIPIYIRNTFNPDFEGTYIGDKAKEKGKSKIKGLSSMGNVTLVTVEGSGLHGIPGTAARLFTALARKDINIIMITQGSSEHSICVGINDDKIEAAQAVLSNEFEREIESGFINPIKIENELCIIAIVGEQMKSIPGVAGRLFSSLGRNGINVIAIAQGSSELNISFVIKKKDENKALNLIHDSFFLSEAKRVNVFMIGVGLIGGTLLQQILDQAPLLKKNQQIDIRICGISNSKKMLFDKNGIHLDTWKDELLQSDHSADLSNFVSEMKTLNLPNTLFIDNTATDKISAFYKEILSSNISIATPNKVAASSSYAQYQELKQIAKDRNVHFLYETNVGAGLPIISTLRNLMESGDEVIKIEAVLSGTISYIFNSFGPGKSFKSVVEAAKDKGLTEPDPRDDLSGQDIQRKITILARESGAKTEMSDVLKENILPQACLDAADVPSFFDSLGAESSYFDSLLEDASKDGKVLRYIASYVDGKASMRLEKVNEQNPFYSLEDSDNMVVFYTKRYHTRPLVIRGPGAGAQVTAAGVFSEIISIANAYHNN